MGKVEREGRQVKILTNTMQRAPLFKYKIPTESFKVFPSFPWTTETYPDEPLSSVRHIRADRTQGPREDSRVAHIYNA